MFINEFQWSSVNEYKWLLASSFAAFFIPFVFQGPQLLVGSVVNALLVGVALEKEAWKALPIIALPSLGVITYGLLFGSFTPFLALMVPFIWLGNAALVQGMKSLERRLGYWSALVASSAAKTTLLFASALALNAFGLVPAAIVAAMGVMQFVTALIGGSAIGLAKRALPF